MAKIKCSSYLRDKIDVMTELVALLMNYFDYASILGSDTKGKTFSVTAKATSIQDFSGNECGFVVRVLKAGRYFEYSFNEWDEPEVIFELVKKLYLEDLQIQKESHLENFDEIMCSDAMIYESDEKTIQTSLDEIGVATVIEILTKAKDKLLAFDERIVNAVITLNNVHVSKAFIASCKELYQGYMYSELMVNATVREDDKVFSEYQFATGLKGLEVLECLDEKIELAAKGALELLKSEPLTPGVYDVICTPLVSGVIAHEAFGHGVEMDMFVKNRALAKNHIGEVVASPLVTMVDGAHPKEEVASYLFDDEGNLGQETVLIEKGILQHGICDEASGLRLKSKLTGNGRRESFERKAYSRMTNTYFEKGESKVEDMIASIRYGFLLDGVNSGMEDPKHWGIQCVLAKAKEIVDGQLTGRIFAPVILTGYVPELLKSITMVSDEVVLHGGGSCGKGYKEWVKVSDGGPYLKAKARLG